MDDSREHSHRMHRDVEWLTAADVRILEFLYAARDTRNNPSIQTPKTIAINTGHPRKYVGQRCRTLVDRGLVEKVDRGEYRLAELGERLMSGRVQPKDL